MTTGYTPIYQIKKDGLDITGHFSDRCTQLRIDSDSGGTDTVLFTLDDRDWAIARPSVGDRVQVNLGYVEVGMNYMGSFEIDEVTFTGTPKSIIIKGSSQGQQSLYKSQMTMNLEGKTLGEIAGIMASKGGLQALVHPKVAGIPIQYRNMTTSPSQIIAELKRQFGLIMKVVDGKLIATPVDGGESASGATMPTVVLTGEHFGSWSVKHTVRAAYSHAIAGYVDPDTYIKKFERFDLKPIDGITDLPFVIERMFNNQQEAQAAAKSQAQALQRSLGEADLQLAKGDPWITAQQRILIRGMRDGVNGSYVADIVSHTYVKDQGILTSIKARPDSNAEDYEELFKEASEEFKRQNFIVPGAGGLIGSLFALGGGDASKTGPTGASTRELIDGLNPFNLQ